MIIDAGSFDRFITIQQKQPARDSLGAEIITWVTYAQVWAQRAELSVREFLNNRQQMQQRGASFVVRFTNGVKADMRVLDEDGRIYNIIGVQQIGGRMQYLRLMVEDFVG